MTGSSARQTSVTDPYYHDIGEHFLTRHTLTTSCINKKEMNTSMGYMIQRKGVYETHNAQCGKDFF
jgi:hypothetical protein